MAGNYAILTKTGISTVQYYNITGNIPIAATALTAFSLTADSINIFSTSSQLNGHAFGASYVAPTLAALSAAVVAMETA
jgi:hypothetical protein